MSDKTELPKEWIEKAQSYGEQSNCADHFTNQISYLKSVSDSAFDYKEGAKAMRDAMEKMLKEKSEYYLSIASDVQKEDIERCVLMHKFSALCNELFTELTSLTPTQDGK